MVVTFSHKSCDTESHFNNTVFNLNNWLADGLLVSSLFNVVVACPKCLMPAPPALLLLRILLHEPLGHRLPLPHVPWLCGYVSEVSMNGGNAQG